ncbi:hypothetical protein AVEN_43995-1 [Araneus ventricosus]|uniref:Uncharacterized protein n=1 Tax=Araneus ventricosus TaxID=182803 RepID=A0A4Y2MEH0_ARAVE|nr:hypothetical protein AVEN_43995-1 [Araneus ventricosus]
MKELKCTGSDACKEVVAKAQGRVKLYKSHNYLLVPSGSIKEVSHPPYPSGSYNLATGLPCNEASDNCLTSQLLVVHRQRAAATATISPSCQPYPSHSLQHLSFNCSGSTDQNVFDSHFLIKMGMGYISFSIIYFKTQHR